MAFPAVAAGMAASAVGSAVRGAISAATDDNVAARRRSSLMDAIETWSPAARDELAELLADAFRAGKKSAARQAAVAEDRALARARRVAADALKRPVGPSYAERFPDAARIGSGPSHPVRAR